MKICFFGSSLVSSFWNGAATYYRGLLKALAALGHDVTFYEPDAYQRQRNRDIEDPPWARVVVYPATDEGWRAALDEAVASADLLVKASGVGVFDRELEEAMPQCCSPQRLVIYWDVDAPATLEAMSADEGHHLRRAIPLYDAVLTYGGGEPVVSRYLGFGARHCEPIYNALDPETHHPAPPRSDWNCTLSFLGNRLPDRESRVEEFFLRPAAKLPDQTFLIGGSGWDDKAMPGNVRRAGHVGTRDHNAFFCSGRMTLNVNRDSMARFGFSPPTRVFEAAGAAACLMTDEWSGIDQFLAPGEEVLVARDGDAVVEHLRAVEDASARRIGQNAMRRVLSEHTYRHRARQVAELLDLQITAREAAE